LACTVLAVGSPWAKIGLKKNDIFAEIEILGAKGSS